MQRAYLSIFLPSLIFIFEDIHLKSTHSCQKNSILLIRNQFRVYGEKVLIQFMLLLPLFNDSRLFSMFKRSLSNTQKPIFLNLFSSSRPPSSLLPSTIRKDPYTQKCHFHSKRYECKINAKSNDENAELLLKWPK